MCSFIIFFKYIECFPCCCCYLFYYYFFFSFKKKIKKLRISFYVGSNLTLHIDWTNLLSWQWYMGRLGEAKVSCTWRHWGIQLKLAYNRARPAVFAAGKGRDGMFVFFLFLHFHLFSSFSPVPLFHLYYYLFYLYLLGEDTRVDCTFLFSQKTEFIISCKLSPLETICMICWILFSGKIKKNISVCLMLKILLEHKTTGPWIIVDKALFSSRKYYFLSFLHKKHI